MPDVLVRFWAGAQRAAGHEQESLAAATVGELRAQLAARPALTKVCAVASFLVDGRQAGDATALHAGAEVDVLPPFAGGRAARRRHRRLDQPDIGHQPAAGRVPGRGGRARRADRLDHRRARSRSCRSTPATPTRRCVAPLIDPVRAADCVVIGTPGYHGGMSGLVKNALDHLELLRDDDRPYLDGRAVGVIVTAAGWQACGTALVSVRSAIHALRGWPTPFGVTVNSAEQSPDDERVTGALQVLAEPAGAVRVVAGGG